MKLHLRYAAALLLVPFTAAGYMACSSDEATTGSDAGPAATTTTTPTSTTTTTTTPGQDAQVPTDASTGDSSTDSGCVYTAPNVDGGGKCGTYVFGTAAVNASTPQAGGAYDGGTLPPGIYDVTVFERASEKGSWRETLALDGTRFTRIRQIDTGSGTGSLGPVTYRSGTYTTGANGLVLTFDCAFDDTAASDAGSNTVPYEVVQNGCESSIRYGAAGLRTTLKRRP